MNKLLDFVQLNLLKAKEAKEDIFVYADYLLAVIHDYGLDEIFPFQSSRWTYQIQQVIPFLSSNVGSTITLQKK